MLLKEKGCITFDGDQGLYLALHSIINFVFLWGNIYIVPGIKFGLVTCIANALILVLFLQALNFNMFMNIPILSLAWLQQLRCLLLRQQNGQCKCGGQLA